MIDFEPEDDIGLDEKFIGFLSDEELELDRAIIAECRELQDATINQENENDS